MTKKAMLIPLNTKTRQDLCLSVIHSKEDQRTIYSVAVMSIANGVGMDSLPSWRKLLGDDEENSIMPVACMEDFEVIKGTDLYDCIDRCMKQIKKSCILVDA